MQKNQRFYSPHEGELPRVLNPTQLITFDYFQLRYLGTSNFAQRVVGINYFSEKLPSEQSLFMACPETSQVKQKPVTLGCYGDK